MSSKKQTIQPIPLNTEIIKTANSSQTSNLFGGLLGKVIIFATAFLFMLIASQIGGI